FHGFQVGIHEVGDGVGVDIFGDDFGAKPLQDHQHPAVVTAGAHHVLVEQFQGEYALATGDDLGAGGGAAVLVVDQGALVIGLKGITNPQGNAQLAQTFGGTRVNCLHAQVGQLVGHVIVGAADGNDFFAVHHFGVGTAEVVLLMDNGLAGTSDRGNLAEGDFAVAPVIGPDQAFAAVGVTGNDGQLPAEVDAFKGGADLVFEAWQVRFAPAGQVHQAGINALGLEQRHGVPGTVGFTQGGQ